MNELVSGHPAGADYIIIQIQLNSVQKHMPASAPGQHENRNKMAKYLVRCSAHLVSSRLVSCLGRFGRAAQMQGRSFKLTSSAGGAGLCIFFFSACILID